MNIGLQSNAVPALLTQAGRKSSQLVAFASGKGGVGKTVCTANLALHLAELRRILTVDMDLGCGNLNASLGVRAVSNSINDFLGSRVATLTPLKTPTVLAGLELISCSYSPTDNTILAPAQKERLLEHLRSAGSDYVFMDLGAGVSDDVLDLFAAADLRVLVTGPESLALHNAFGFVNSLVYRITARSLEQVGLPRRTRENIVRQLYDSGDLEIGKTIERIRLWDSVTADTIQTVLSGIQIQLIMNKVQESAEERYVTKLQQLSRKYSQIELNYLGSIPYDDNVKKSLNDIVPFALEYHTSPANAAFRSVAHRLDAAMSEARASADAPRVDRTAATRRFTMLLEDRWAATAARFRPRPVVEDEVHREHEIRIEQLSRELSEARLSHGKAAIARRQSLLARDARIAALEQELRESEEIIRTLKEQVSRNLAPMTAGEQILAALSRHPPHRITIVQMEEGGSESALFADEIGSLLREAQWVINSVSSSFQGSPFTGLRIIHDDTPQSIEGARILAGGLLAAGIEYITLLAPFPTEFERIRLVVARRGNETQRTLKAFPATANLRQP